MAEHSTFMKASQNETFDQLIRGNMAPNDEHNLHEEEDENKSSRRDLIFKNDKFVGRKETMINKASAITERKQALTGILGDEVKRKMNEKRLNRMRDLNSDFEPLIMELICIPFNEQTCVSVLQ